MSVERTIVACGGMTEAHGGAMESYVLGLTGKERPRICFLQGPDDTRLELIEPRPQAGGHC